MLLRLSKIKDGTVKLSIIFCVFIFALSSFLGYLSYASLKFGLPPTLEYNSHDSPTADTTNFTILNSVGHDGETYGHDFHEWNRVMLDQSENILIYGLALANVSSGVNNDIFLVKMSQSADILWSTRYGGAKQEYLGSHPVLIDSQNNIYVYGETNSSDLLLKNAKYGTPDFSKQIRVSFLLKFSSEGELKLATYLQDSILAAILDNNDKLWIIQDTGKDVDLRIYSNNFDLLNSFTISNSRIEIPYYHTYYNDIDEIHGTSILFDELNNFIMVGTVYNKGLVDKNSIITDPSNRELFLLR